VDEATQQVIIGRQTNRRLAQRLREFGFLDPPDQSRDDCLCDLVLYREDVIESAVVAFCPQVNSALGLNELSGDAHAVAGPAHAAFDQIGHAELAPHLGKSGRFAAKGERRVAGDHEQGSEARQPGDDVLGNAVTEGLLRLAAQIVERQDRDGRLVGQAQRCVSRVARRHLGPAPDPHRARTGVFKYNIRFADKLVVDGARDTDPTRFGQGFEPRGHVHSVPEQVLAVDYDVAEVDADPEDNASFW
jgi:hypothetical protein